MAGRAAVVDGDTIRLGGERIRLLGIDAPEIAQDCTNGEGVPWACGAGARTMMRQLLGQGPVTCRAQGHDRYGRVLARCSQGARDIAAAMVKAGLAVADGGYGAEQRQARAAKAGIWAGDFQSPAVWRHTHGEGTPSLIEIGMDWLRRWLGW
jgi:endonuclease YncB( thermonuclease family)